MDVGFFDVFYHVVEVEFGVVVECVDVDFYCVVEELVDEYWMCCGDFGGVGDVVM